MCAGVTALGLGNRSKFKSGLSKLVKRAIAASKLGPALKKTFAPRVEESFEIEARRLQEMEFLVGVLSSVCEKFLRYVKKEANGVADWQKVTNYVVIPYKHKLAHGLNSVANRYGVNVVLPPGIYLEGSAVLLTKILDDRPHVLPSMRSLKSRRNVTVGLCTIFHCSVVTCILVKRDVGLVVE